MRLTNLRTRKRHAWLWTRKFQSQEPLSKVRLSKTFNSPDWRGSCRSCARQLPASLAGISSSKGKGWGTDVGWGWSMARQKMIISTSKEQYLLLKMSKALSGRLNRFLSTKEVNFRSSVRSHLGSRVAFKPRSLVTSSSQSTAPLILIEMMS